MMALSGLLPQKNFGKLLFPLVACCLHLQDNPLGKMSGSVGRISDLVNPIKEVLVDTRAATRTLNSDPAQHTLSTVFTKYLA
jgi:hypothetical protein